MTEHILAIKDILISFLKENGGYSNGYVTYIEGSVSKNSYNSLDWCTPSQEELTGKEVKLRGREVYESVRRYLHDNNIDNALIITNRHTEHGCYETYIKFDTPATRLSL